MFQKGSLFALILAVAEVFVWGTICVNAQIVTDGLVSYWSFDSDTIEGEIVKDVWGEHDGTISGNPMIVDGKIGQALKFDGEKDYIEVPHSEEFTVSGKTISVEVWIRIESLPAKHAIVLGKRGTEYEVGINADGEPTWFCLGDNSLGSAREKLSEGNWYHVVWIWDESSGQTYIYLDNQQIGSYVTGDKSADSADPVNIGRDPQTADASKYHFNGVIDEVRFYNRALNEAEIRQNYMARGFAVAWEGKKLSSAWGQIKCF